MRGSKVRASVQGRSQLCPHSIKRSQGNIELVMECEECKNSGLELQPCFRGVLKAIQQEGIPSAIILRSHIEKRYDIPSTWTMSQLARILNHTDDLISQISVDAARSGKCTDCLGSLGSGLGRLKESLLSMRIADAIKLANELESHEFRKGAKCDQCSGMMRMRLAKISSMAREIENHVLAGAFHIVGVEG